MDKEFVISELTEFLAETIDILLIVLAAFAGIFAVLLLALFFCLILRQILRMPALKTRAIKDIETQIAETTGVCSHPDAKKLLGLYETLSFLEPRNPEYKEREAFYKERSKVPWCSQV